MVKANLSVEIGTIVENAGEGGGERKGEGKGRGGEREGEEKGRGETKPRHRRNIRSPRFGSRISGFISHS